MKTKSIKSNIKEIEKEEGMSLSEFKALILKYGQLNDVSLKLYENLMEEIPQMLSQKVENKKTKLPMATFQMSIKVKEAFTEIMNDDPMMKINEIALWDYIHYHLYLPDQWLRYHRHQNNGSLKLRPAVC